MVGKVVGCVTKGAVVGAFVVVWAGSSPQAVSASRNVNNRHSRQKWTLFITFPP